MKKYLLLAITVLSMLVYLVGCAGAPMQAKLPGASGGDKVDLDALATREGRIITLVSKATLKILESYSDIYEAAGLKEKAEKMKSVMTQLKDNAKNVDKIKEAVGEVNNASKEINAIDFAKDLNEELAKKNLKKSILNLGIGLTLDGLAVPDATALLKDAKDALTKVQSNPVAYGPTAVANVTRVIGVATFISSDVATQVNSLTEISKKMYDYATMKGIPVPTKEEIDKSSSNLDKE